MPSFSANPAPIILRYNGLFDFDAMYAAVIDWTKNYGYIWHEKAYKHKVPNPKGAEQELEWEMSININEYVKYSITFSIHAWELNEVDVDIDGKKKTLSNGRLYMVINGKVECDWQNKFGTSKFGAWLGEKYFQLMMKNISLEYADGLYYRMWNLHALLKSYFDMQSKKQTYKNYLGES